MRSVFRSGLPDRSGEPFHVASRHKNLRVSLVVGAAAVAMLLLTFSSHQVRAEAIAPLNFWTSHVLSNFAAPEKRTEDFVEPARYRHRAWLDGRRENNDRNGKVAARLVKVQYQEARGPV